MVWWTCAVENGVEEASIQGINHAVCQQDLCCAAILAEFAGGADRVRFIFQLNSCSHSLLSVQTCPQPLWLSSQPSPAPRSPIIQIGRLCQGPLMILQFFQDQAWRKICGSRK